MDIAELLYHIKENIKKVEEGNESEIILKEINDDFLRLTELVKLFLISERDSYYGYFLMNMRFKTDFFSNSIAGIKLNEYPPLFVANPLLLCKFTLKEIIYTFCHEIDHVVLNHPVEMVKANPNGDEETFKEFNLAADAAVNDRIDYEIKKEKHNFMARAAGLITSSVLSKMYNLGKIKEVENYAYYFNLIKDKDSLNSSFSNGKQAMMFKQNQCENANSNESSKKNDESQNKNGNGNIVTSKNHNGNLEDHNWEAGNDAEDVASNIKQFVNAAFDMMNEDTRGLMPGYFMSQVELINKPSVLSWQKILKKYIGTITADKRKTKTRLNRRQPERFDLSGTIDEKILKIVVAIDTSGSVNDEMIGRIFNEIFAILAKRKHEITVIECDSEIKAIYKAKNRNEIKRKVHGRGGTCFTPVIKYVNDNKYYRDALLIYFTDGYGEMHIPKPYTYRNIWVVFNNKKYLSVQEPYGIVLTIEE